MFLFFTFLTSSPAPSPNRRRGVVIFFRLPPPIRPQEGSRGRSKKINSLEFCNTLHVYIKNNNLQFPKGIGLNHGYAYTLTLSALRRDMSGLIILFSTPLNIAAGNPKRRTQRNDKSTESRAKSQPNQMRKILTIRNQIKEMFLYSQSNSVC